MPPPTLSLQSCTEDNDSPWNLSNTPESTVSYLSRTPQWKWRRMHKWTFTRHPRHLFTPRKKVYGHMDFLCPRRAMLRTPIYYQNSGRKQWWLHSLWQAHHTGWRTSPSSCNQVGGVSIRASTAEWHNVSQRCVLLHFTDSKCVLVDGALTQDQWLLLLTDLHLCYKYTFV